MGKKKDNLRRGKRGPVPRFDYHVILHGEVNEVHRYISNVKDILFLAWENKFKMDSHVLNKYILRDGRAVFRRRDGSLMVVVRTPKHTTDELVELYISGTENDREYVDNYIGLNAGMRRKVSPIVKRASGGQLKLRPSKERDEAMEAIAKLPLTEVDETLEWLQEMDEKLKKR